MEIAAADGMAEAYVRTPNDGPGVLFLMDGFGIRPTTQRMVDRIAGWGYTVLAPNLFYRSGTIAELQPTEDLTQPGAREAFFQSVWPRAQGLTPDLSRPDLAAYVAALRELAPGPIGVTGYCMGARLALIAACDHPDDIAAAGCFHGGRMAMDAPESPHHGLPRARASFVFGHADNDASMPPEDIVRLETALDAAGLDYTSDVYPGAAHGYTMPDTSAYAADAAERHFAALEELFARTLQ